MACLLKVSVLFHLILVCYGIFWLGWEEYIKDELRSMKKKLRLLEDGSMLILLQLISLHNLIVQFFGIFRAKRTLLSPYTNALSFTSRCWLLLAVESLVFDICKLLLSMHLSQALIQEAQGVLMSGIEMYNIDIYWNIFWNQIQYSNSCCGVIYYKDWRNIKWRNIDQEHIFTQLVQSNKTIVPSSCCLSQITCTIAFVKQYDECFVDVSDLKSVDVFQNGCLLSFIKDVTSKLETGRIVMLSSILIQLVTLIFNRIIFLKNREYL